MFTPKQVIYPASSNPDEILITGEDENGRPVNAPLITDADLAKQLAETPSHIDNPEHAALTAKLAETPAMLPNPDYQPLADQAFAKAEAEIAAHAELMA